LPFGNPANLNAVLKAWKSCTPDGAEFRETQLPALLPTIAAHVTAGMTSAEHARRLGQHFHQVSTSDSGDGSRLEVGHDNSTPFLRSLLRHNGQVHFAYFWRAFQHATNVVAGGAEESVAAPGGELDSFREDVLGIMESSQSLRGRCELSITALISTIRISQAASRVPTFWKAVDRLTISRHGGSMVLGLEEVSAMMFTCLCSALLLWEHASKGLPQSQQDVQLKEVIANEIKELSPPRPTLQVDERSGPGMMVCCAHSELELNTGLDGCMVYLNIYDASQHSSVRWLNGVFAHQLSPVKFGGAFHAGVEVLGLEWSFGATPRETLPGVACVLPRCDPQHQFRQTVFLGKTHLPVDRITAMITDLVEEYPGREYDVLRRNCCHFADDFCQRLGVGTIPSWVHRLARVGAGADGASRAVFGAPLPELCALGSLCSAYSARPVAQCTEGCEVVMSSTKVPGMLEPL